MESKIQVIQYKEFKDSFEFSILKEMAMLNRAKGKTFNSNILTLIEGLENRIFNSPRPKKDIENSIRLHYVFYLIGYFKDRPQLFDNLFLYVNNAIENNDYIDLYEIARHLDRL